MVCEKIVKVNETLASEVASVINEANYMYYRFIIPGIHFKYPIVEVEEIANYMKSMEFFACIVREEIVGVIALKSSGKEGVVRFLYVKPGFQRKGIGSELLRFLEDYAKGKGLRKLSLVVHSRASWAIRFYRSHGFVTIGFRDKGSMAGLHYDENSLMLTSL